MRRNVPRGSILSPLFFLLYLNCIMPYNIGKDSTFIICIAFIILYKENDKPQSLSVTSINNVKNLCDTNDSTKNTKRGGIKY